MIVEYCECSYIYSSSFFPRHFPKWDVTVEFLSIVEQRGIE